MRGVRRAWPVLLGSLLLVTSLAGCASETESYCDELETQKDTLADLAVRSGDVRNVVGATEIGQKPGFKPPQIRRWEPAVFVYQRLEMPIDDLDARRMVAADPDEAVVRHTRFDAPRGRANRFQGVVGCF